MAGESAQDLARRQRLKAERLLESAERYELGAQGERTTGAILDAMRREGWAVFHDVRWPGRVRANIDHVVVGPPGVLVIDSKNWSGRIEIGDNTFRSNGRRQDKTVAAAGDAALAIAELLSAPANATVRSVLCFVRDEPVAGWCHDVMVCSTGNLREMLVTRPAVLAPEHGQVASTELAILVRGAAPQAARARAVREPARRLTPVVRTPAVRNRHRSRRHRGAVARLAAFVVAAAVGLTLLPQLADLGDAVGKQFVTPGSPEHVAKHACSGPDKDPGCKHKRQR
jgi:hypothetical protein